MLTTKQRQILTLYLNEFTQDKAALTIYPFRYEKRELWDQRSFDPTRTFVFSARIVSAISRFRYGRNQSVIRFRVMSEWHELVCVMYNRPFFKNTYHDNEVIVTGSFNDKREFVVSSLNQKKIEESIGLFPIYSLKKGINQYQLRSIMKKVLKEQGHNINEMIPLSLVSKYKLFTTYEALSEIHFPSSDAKLVNALRTLKYSEALRYQLALQLSNQNQRSKVFSKDLSNFNLTHEQMLLPYELTPDQLTSIVEIIDDLNSPLAMRRLLLGDVGSGKTILAYLASKAVISSHYQVAFLCPTEVLALQHYDSFKQLGLIPILLTATTKTTDVLREIKMNSKQIIIGTHALFSDDVIYSKLGLVIIDEQHRFGVKQRQKMIEKGTEVDVLMMSATPIPRTLASTLYSHLNVSFIETMPKGRQPIITKVIYENTIQSIIAEILDFVLHKRQQIYIICPAIDDDETRNVIEITKNLKAAFEKQLRIGSIHSKLTSNEISTTINDFKNHNLDLLVSTTIVEVGVHVDNANMMIIYDADRFGLSQLHQLRGRIGRKDQPGYCYALTSSQNQDSLDRLKIFETTLSGFKLAELDLIMRGTGDLLGQRQSGFPHFSHLDLANDLKILELALNDAKRLIENPTKEATIFVETIKKQHELILNQVLI